MRSQLRAVATLAWFDGILPNLRSPFNTVNFVISPLTILFFIYLFAGPGEAKFAIAGGLIAVLLAFLPPVFYPITVIPEAFRPLAYLAPTTYSAQIIQQAAGLPTGGTNLAIDIAGAALYTFGLVGIAMALSRWRQK